MKNKYVVRARISEYRFRRLLNCFCLDLDASVTSKQVRISRKIVNKYFNKFRKRIFKLSLIEAKMFGEIEIDESYFGARRIRGKRGRGSRGKIPVVGILKRNGKVFTSVVKNCTRQELFPVIRGKILEESTVYTDGWKSYDGLVLDGYKHRRIYHSKDEFVRGKNHINGIESFWSYTKRRLSKFNGIKRENFLLHLKESEFRWNNKQNNLYKALLENFRELPLS